MKGVNKLPRRKAATDLLLVEDITSSISKAWTCYGCEAGASHLINEHADSPAEFRCSTCGFPYSISTARWAAARVLIPVPALNDAWLHAWRRGWLTLGNADLIATLVAASSSGSALDNRVTVAIRERARALQVSRSKEV